MQLGRQYRRLKLGTNQYVTVHQLIGTWDRPLSGSISWRIGEEHDGGEDEAVALVRRRKELDVAGHKEALYRRNAVGGRSSLRRAERGRGQRDHDRYVLLPLLDLAVILVFFLTVAEGGSCGQQEMSSPWVGSLLDPATMGASQSASQGMSSSWGQRQPTLETPFCLSKCEMVNNISGYLPGRIVFFLVRILTMQVNTHLTPRPILLTRHGESRDNVRGRIGGDAVLSSEAGELYAKKLANFVEKRLKSERTASVRITFIQWRALEEINAGVCDGMTYEEIKKNMPDEYVYVSKMLSYISHICRVVVPW
ncbi:hypothetical protein B296_00007356 [Ensete ventricosum]|uniref:6-phosphofructo-2-kinase domain-containing protein n=1 Tax=Ensete ventricosum TaxID=4639 RepID=A0A426ZIM6_ENSVE|nr:hypothetical protein B296_00007356 [Ensete ventricosum]